MKKLLLLFFLLPLMGFAQNIPWIPFQWHGDTLSGRYFDKAAILVPVTVDRLPHRFTMQFDLGTPTSVLYGNAMDPYLEKYPGLKAKEDTTKHFGIQGQKHNLFTGVTLRMGDVPFENIQIGYFKGHGDAIDKDSLDTPSEKHVGTIGSDRVLGKVLILDYPNSRMAIVDEIPILYRDATFQEFKLDNRLVFIPLEINGREETLLFDTGSSLFSLLSSKKNARTIAAMVDVSDSIVISSWGDKITQYGLKVGAPVKFAGEGLKTDRVYYSSSEEFDSFFDRAGIWGVTGNAFFLDRTVIIDFRNRQFGVK